MVPVLWFTPFLKEKQSFKWKQPGLRNYLGTILEELIDQPSWIINTALQPVSQPAEKQVHPLNQSTARETEEEEWNMCVHVCKEKSTNTRKQRGVWECFFSLSITVP